MAEFTKIRLYVTASLHESAPVALSDAQAHYLRNVMRQQAGDTVRLFNGVDGEWAAELDQLSKKGGRAIATKLLRRQDRTGEIDLAFAPIKKAPMAYLVEKATEMGVGRLLPVITARCQTRSVNVERLEAQSVEAAEQSYRMSVPKLAAAQALEPLLADWPKERGLVFCDEGGAMAADVGPALEVLQSARDRFTLWGAIIGPEGGFSDDERRRIRAHPCALAVSLGPRILRAETACVTVLTLMQATLGDLADSPN